MSTRDMTDEGDLGVPLRPLFMSDGYRQFNGQGNGVNLEDCGVWSRNSEPRKKLNRALSAGTPKEKWFLRLVTSASFVDVRSFLEEYPDTFLGCSNHRGETPLQVAVLRGDQDMVQLLLDKGAGDVEDALLVAVHTNDPEMVEWLLQRKQAGNTKRLRGEETPESGSGNSSLQLHSNLFSPDMTPIIIAARNNNYQLVQMLLLAGQHVEEPHPPKCTCSDHCKELWTIGESLYYSLARLHAYEALTSPVYMALASKDPMLKAFKLGNTMRSLAYILPEYKMEYLKMAANCTQFAVNLLDQCRTTEEVQIILKQKPGCQDPRPHTYCRLHVAINYGLREFITHPNCQQVLRSQWTLKMHKWWHYSIGMKLVHVLFCMLFMPIISAIYILVPEAVISKRPFCVPLNRFLFMTSSYLIFTAFLFVSLVEKNARSYENSVSWYDWAIFAWLVGSTWNIFLNAINQKLTYLFFFWHQYDIVMHLMFLCYYVAWLVGYLLNNCAVDRTDINGYNPIIIGECFYALGCTMAFLRILYWFQLHHRMGPLIISLSSMMYNILLFLVVFLLIIFAFTMGLNSIYKYYAQNVVNRTDGSQIMQPAQFTTFGEAFKALVWAVFDEGNPEYADIVVNKNITDVKSHNFTQRFGISLWGIYQFIASILLVNVMIAMMSDTFQKIQDQADCQWKFARTKIWIHYFEPHNTVPTPFNLIPSASAIQRFFRHLFHQLYLRINSVSASACSSVDCCSCLKDHHQEDKDAVQQEYQELMQDVIKRYMQVQSQTKEKTAAKFSIPNGKGRESVEVGQNVAW